MAKMRIAPADRPRVKLECLRLLATLKLDRARQGLIRDFMDSYLRLSAAEMTAYDEELRTIDEPEREMVMQIVNEWEVRGQVYIILRQLQGRFGEVPAELRERVAGMTSDKLEALAGALFDFTSMADAADWVAART